MPGLIEVKSEGGGGSSQWSGPPSTATAASVSVPSVAVVPRAAPPVVPAVAVGPALRPKEVEWLTGARALAASLARVTVLGMWAGGGGTTKKEAQGLCRQGKALSQKAPQVPECQQGQGAVRRSPPG